MHAETRLRVWGPHLARLAWMCAVLAVCGAAGALRAQPVAVYADLSLGHYAFDEVRSAFREQGRSLRAEGVPVKTFGALPAYPGGSVGLGFALSDDFASLAEVGTSSTGGRHHYADYSGEFLADLVVRRVYAGVGLAVTPSAEPVVLRLRVRTRLTWSQYRSDATLRVGEERAAQADRLDATGLSVVGDLALGRRLGPVEVLLHGGFEQSILSGILGDRLQNRFHYRGRPTQLVADWSGVRGGVTVAYAIRGW